MKKRIFSVRTMSILALLTIPAVIIFTVSAVSNKPEPVSTKSVVRAPKVTTVTLEAGRNVSQFELYGEVSAPEQLSLLGEVSGRVVWQSAQFKVGHRVSKGDLLIKLDDASYRVELADAKKLVADGYLALLQERRNKRLAETDWKVSGIKEQASELGLREPQLAIALARYDAAKEKMNLARTKLEKTKVYAPFDAVVVAKNVVLGSYVGQTSQIGQLKSIATAEIKLALSEAQWHQLPKKLTEINAQVISRDNASLTWPANATDLSLTVNNKTRTRNLTLVVNKPLAGVEPLLLGSFVKVSVTGSHIEDSFALPSAAVTADGFIWFERGGKLYKQKVKPVFYSQQTVTIPKKELSSKLNLVKKPLSSYVEGMAVMASSNMEQADVR